MRLAESDAEARSELCTERSEPTGLPIGPSSSRMFYTSVQIYLITRAYEPRVSKLTHTRKLGNFLR